MPEREFSIVTLEPLDQKFRHHLLRNDGQEDLTFALYRPISGALRDTAMLVDILDPLEGERTVHGNASFGSAYFQRVLGVARARGCGLAFMHSHPIGEGWQGMSDDDETAEKRLAPRALAATGMPVVGLTLAGDGQWSGRRWQRTGARTYERQWADNVRVVGKRLAVSLPPRPIAVNEAFDRSELVWGKRGREILSRLRVGIVGLGSVGSIVAETMARVGIERLVLVDHDRLEIVNLDRTLNATRDVEGELKVQVAADAVRAHAPAQIDIRPIGRRCDEADAYRALLDCDFVFCCVDRPWGRRILNQLAYANAIPVSNGGLLARTRKGKFLGADWHVHVIGPGRRCMQCWSAFDPAGAALDVAGLLDDPSYVKELDPNSPLIAHANAMPYALSVASMQAMQFAAMILGPQHDLGDWNFHAATGACETKSDTGCDPDCIFAEHAGDVSWTPPLRTEAETDHDARPQDSPPSSGPVD